MVGVVSSKVYSLVGNPTCGVVGSVLLVYGLVGNQLCGWATVLSVQFGWNPPV